MSVKYISYCSQRLANDSWVLLPFWKDHIARFDRDVKENLENAPALLSTVPLSVFGATLLDTKKYYPRARSFLPIMAEDTIQRAWTGSTGTDLLETSISFVQQTLGFCSQQLGGVRHDMTILDFGVGWGRIARLWLKYLPPGNVKGCDAWEKSINLAKGCGLKNQIVQSDPMLTVLPFPEGSFDLVYAMSIFTHLDEVAFTSCFRGISKMIKQGGGFLFTVRPNVFWEVLRSDLTDHALLSRTPGFVFKHGSFDPRFGDTTVDLEWLDKLAKSCDLKIVGVEWSPSDAMQVIIQMTKLH